MGIGQNVSINKDDFYRLARVNSHSKFDSFLRDLIHDKEGRETFYDKLIDENIDLSKDMFLDYFQEYGAERKTNMQDYTPTEVAELLAKLTAKANYIYDGAAGTGSLIIQKWNENKQAEVRATEYGDNVIHYLLHNLAIRNIKAIVVHGDTISSLAQAVYSLIPAETYSDVYLLPQTEKTLKTANIRGFSDEI